MAPVYQLATRAVTTAARPSDGALWYASNNAMVSADFGFALMDRYGLSGDEAIAAVREAIARMIPAPKRR